MKEYDNNPLRFMFESNEVRVLDIDGEPWFVAKDVCRILGYTDGRKALMNFCRGGGGVSKRNTLTKGGIQELSTIAERDVYRLIMRSKRPEAQDFEDWVVGTILPSIRKTGGYVQGEEHIESEEELTLRVMQMLQRKVDAMKPKAEYFDSYVSHENLKNTTSVAKMLGISAIRLNNFLRQQGVKWKDKDFPRAGYEDWFSVKTVNNTNGPNGITQCLITSTGEKEIIDLWEQQAA